MYFRDNIKILLFPNNNLHIKILGYSVKECLIRMNLYGTELLAVRVPCNGIIAMYLPQCTRYINIHWCHRRMTLRRVLLEMSVKGVTCVPSCSWEGLGAELTLDGLVLRPGLRGPLRDGPFCLRGSFHFHFIKPYFYMNCCRWMSLRQHCFFVNCANDCGCFLLQIFYILLNAPLNQT